MTEGVGGGAGAWAANDTEPVGTLAEEAAKLFSAVVSGAGREHGDGQACPHAWCPACHAAEFVQDHPEVVAQVMTAGHELVQALRSVVEVATERRDRA